MAERKDTNSVSVWWWMFALFVMVLPCLGFVMVLVWAFVGENETRKNYFRAVIAWHVVFIAFLVVAVLAGFIPEIMKQIQSWLHPAR